MIHGLSLLFYRLAPGFRHVRVSGPSMSAFVSVAEGDKATILVNQPGDCLAFQRDDITLNTFESIDVWFGYKFTSQINGPEMFESPEVWQTALHHLLNTYKPRYCYIHTGGTETGLGEEVRVEGEHEECFRGFWDDKRHLLSIKK